MTPFPYSVELHAPVGMARLMMLEHGVRHLPVTQNGKLVGVITDRDIKLILGPELGNPDPTTVTVEETYVEHCYTVDINSPLLSVLKHMADHRIGSAVVTSKGRIAGIFTSVDACNAFARHLQAQFHPGEGEPPEAA